MRKLRQDALPIIRQDTDHRRPTNPHRNAWRRAANLHRELANLYTPLVLASDTDSDGNSLLEQPQMS